MKYLIPALIFLLFLGSAAAAQTGSHQGTVKIEIDLSAYNPAEEARLWLPYPISDNYQRITNIKIKGDFAESAVYSDQVFQTPMLFASWDNGAKSRKLLFSFDVERQEVARRDFPQNEPKWNPADYKEYLKSTSLGPTTGSVKKLADKIIKGKTTVLAKAKAIYGWTVNNMYRDPETPGCGKGNVCELLEKPGGKCVDIHSAFVALARAAGVPAREVFGLRLAKKGSEDVSTWQHCWAEFFVPGYGWVPADPADVRKAMLTDNLDLKNPKIVELRKYYWGGLDAYRVKLSMGRDLILNPRQKGLPLNYLMYPYAEIGNQVPDSIDPKLFKYRISFASKQSEAR